MEFVVVTKPIDQDGTFDEAVKGVSVIAHTASPTTFTPEVSTFASSLFYMEGKSDEVVKQDSERDVMIPAIRGTTGILRSAALEHSVKAIVITSS